MHACLSKPADFIVMKRTPGIPIIPIPQPSAYMRAMARTRALFGIGLLVGSHVDPTSWDIYPTEWPWGHPTNYKDVFIGYDAVRVPMQSVTIEALPVLRDGLRAGITLDRIRRPYRPHSPLHIVYVGGGV